MNLCCIAERKSYPAPFLAHAKLKVLTQCVFEIALMISIAQQTMTPQLLEILR
jgi:hypothetical protein